MTTQQHYQPQSDTAINGNTHAPSLADVMATGQVWQGRHWEPDQAESQTTGFRELDRLLGGGWLRGALTEVLFEQAGMGEMRLLVPALAELSRQNRWLMLLAPPMMPNATALEAAGVDTSKLLIVRPESVRDQLWTLEESLRSGTCSAVLAWPEGLNQAQTRRLQLAAEAGQCLGVLFRPASQAAQPSTAAVRLQLQAGPRGTQVDLRKRRGRVQTTEEQLELNLDALTNPYRPAGNAAASAAVIQGPWGHTPPH